MKAIEANGLTKRYKDTTALDDVSFDVKQGEIFGFIGPDGAGKTTLFRIITSLLLPDKGNAYVLGKNVVKNYKWIRQVTGYMPGRFSLYMDLSVEENLEFFARVFGTTIEENYDLVKDIYSQIEPFKTRKARDLSGGMKQKLALSCALIHRPELLVLDEPTTGVDAVSRKEFWEMLKQLKAHGISILVSTPYMDEASLCDRVALIQKGEILAIDSPENIEKKYPYPIFSMYHENLYELMLALREFPLSRSVFPFGQYLHYTPKKGGIDLAQLEHYMKEKGFENIEIQEISPGIEDCFMEFLQQKEQTPHA